MGNTCCRDAPHPAGKKNGDVEQVNYAFFSSLPSDVQEATIDHVYDGDTLTIHEQNRARVRLLGIDAPELKAKEPYAKEAADYVKSLCPPGSRVWLRFQADEKKDRYNRLLAFVFIANPVAGKPGYMCVNISLLQEGLAVFYEPSGSVEHKDPMLKAMQVAIAGRRNIWRKANLQRHVYTTPNGIAFHNPDCLTIQKVRPQNLRKQSIAEALEKGYSSCRECKPL
ncbi:hypothetical protein ABB37_01978 [Leptomonas pyrrhocoris]|uniref:TNase-like domain-containing protein n=1 Tax=Leptomonas pyrrhocoris TaxID=157538 RepID=A0A0N0DY50_LEPPY|nr:hypothetical protein ABB37_01978 [Leptomonas pyrrhocoris]KPA83735.1 hypothetical protein ABB37_01978 [Leptomonas pyrrhocoris]|eukprot:XP_015662174.1 hypothetical protein ABB37_01978 [Leptomonas pyrrhocoris]